MGWFDFQVEQSSIQLQFATQQDAKAIGIMSRILIEEGLTWSWTPEKVARHIQNPNSLVVIAKNYGEILGFAILECFQARAHLSLLAISIPYQRMGIGKHLIAFLEQCVWFSGITLISLEVRKKNHCARKFYHSLEYDEVRNIPKYYGGRETAIQLIHHLKIPSPTWT